MNFPGPGATWRYHLSYGDINEDRCLGLITYEIQVSDDSTIHDKNYTLLKLKQTQNHTVDYFNNYFYCFIDTLDYELGTIGGLRSEGEKTYFYGLNNLSQSIFGLEISDTTDILLYDFSKIPGDTIQYINDEGEITYDSILEVNTITLADGIPRKQQKLSYSLYYIQGIGDNMDGLFGSRLSEVYTSIISSDCYKENELYLTEGPYCGNDDYAFDTPPITDQMIFTYPNPFQYTFRYDIPYDNSVIRVYSMDGKLHIEQETQLPNGYISTQHLSSGTYIVTCTSSDGYVAYNVMYKSTR